MNAVLPVMQRPAKNEFAPFYAAYVGAVPDVDIVEYLTAQKELTIAFLKTIVWEKWEVGYAPGKWSLGELMLHVIDTERVFAYRALSIARGDTTPLPGFDQDTWVPNSGAQERHPASIVDEYAAVREATLHLFRNFNDEMWQRRGTASDNGVSVRALAWIIAGHELHHLKVVRERYL